MDPLQRTRPFAGRNEVEDAPAAASISEAHTSPRVGLAEAQGGAPRSPASDPPRIDLAPGALDDAGAERYAARAVLGEGGMGVVQLCRDARIGRDVARKAIREAGDAAPGLEERFLREARVQGQLEHPAVVPVYDLGRDAEGRPYFTMKRVRGSTLEDVLSGLRRGDRELARRFSRRKLLGAFGQVCLTIDYAHAHGVVHRDLKPGNVMLGDFGEVYVLDWGLAKLAGISEAPAPTATPVPLAASADAPLLTADGALMGTPGYMAPEQVRPGSFPVDRQADVYALGAILFEILTLEPLHARGTVEALLASTLAGADTRAAARAPDREIPPELESVCAVATALDPRDRYASARDLHDAVDRFLDGDRDLEQRRQLAADHVRVAELAAARALSGAGKPGADRAMALRELGRALALDPTHAGAAQSMVALLVAPPEALPPDARAEFELSRASALKVAARAGGWAYLSWFLYIPLVLWLGVRSWPMAIGLCVLMGASALVSFVVARRSTGGATGPFAILAVSTLAIAAFSRVAGPFIVAPSLAVANTVGFAMFPDRKLRALMVALGSSAIVAPALLEWAGVLPPSYAFRDGTLVVLPQVHGFPPVPTMATLLVTAVAIVVTSSIFVSRIRDALDDAEERLYAYAWSLRQLVPDEARHAAQAPTVAPPTDYVACLVESLVDQHGPELRARLAARIGRG